MKASESSPTQEPPWAKPKRWMEEGGQEGEPGVVTVRWERTRRRRERVEEGFGFGITEGGARVSRRCLKVEEEMRTLSKFIKGWPPAPGFLFQ